MSRLLVLMVPPLFAMYVPTCVPRAVSPTAAPGEARLEELWQQPADLEAQDLLYGPWGLERAPDPDATYRFVEMKQGGVNPGMTVRDPGGRRWKVKQPAMDGRVAEGPIEVVLSRVLSAVGYHQPPVYYLPDFTVKDKSGTRRVPGGRFRLVDPSLEDRGEWSWHRNPFVGTRPYQGLLVILLLFNSSDLKNSNNTLYEYRARRRSHRAVVRRARSRHRAGRHRPYHPAARQPRAVRAPRLHHGDRRRVRGVRVSRLAPGAGAAPHPSCRCSLGLRAARRPRPRRSGVKHSRPVATARPSATGISTGCRRRSARG